jgi:hypothetical protein
VPVVREPGTLQPARFARDAIRPEASLGTSPGWRGVPHTGPARGIVPRREWWVLLPAVRDRPAGLLPVEGNPAVQAGKRSLPAARRCSRTAARVEKWLVGRDHRGPGAPHLDTERGRAHEEEANALDGATAYCCVDSNAASWMLPKEDRDGHPIVPVEQGGIANALPPGPDRFVPCHARRDGEAEHLDRAMGGPRPEQDA